MGFLRLFQRIVPLGPDGPAWVKAANLPKLPGQLKKSQTATSPAKAPRSLLHTHGDTKVNPTGRHIEVTASVTNKPVGTTRLPMPVHLSPKSKRVPLPDILIFGIPL
jgi:hypothetical protein